MSDTNIPEQKPKSAETAVKRSVDRTPVVTVIGGGIAGMTAAHELVERGFKVFVVEKTPSQDRFADCHVGGMASSSYGRSPDDFDSDGLGDASASGSGLGAILRKIREMKMLQVPNRVGHPEKVRYTAVRSEVDSLSSGQHIGKFLEREDFGTLKDCLERANAEYSRQHQRFLEANKQHIAKEFPSVAPLVEAYLLGDRILVNLDTLLRLGPPDQQVLVERPLRVMQSVCKHLFRSKASSKGFKRLMSSTRSRLSKGLGKFMEELDRKYRIHVPIKMKVDLGWAKLEEAENALPRNLRLNIPGQSAYEAEAAGLFPLMARFLPLLLEFAEAPSSLGTVEDGEWVNAFAAFRAESFKVHITISAKEEYGREISKAVLWRLTGKGGLSKAQIRLESRVLCCIENPARFDFEIQTTVLERRIPGEHGFRFFPSFYRHLFDTMRRTPILDKDRKPGHETAFDQLVPVDSMDVANTGAESIFEIKRNPPRSLGDWRDTYNRLTGQLGIGPHDVHKILIRILKYATSSSLRRESEFEEIPWMQFLGGTTNFNPQASKILSHLPRAMAGMLPKEVDARTHGNIQFQLMLDFFADSRVKDMTLNGPTSEAWLDPWKKYLEWQGVRFINGELIALRRGKDLEEIHPVFGSIEHLDITVDELMSTLTSHIRQANVEKDPKIGSRLIRLFEERVSAGSEKKTNPWDPAVDAFKVFEGELDDLLQANWPFEKASPEPLFEVLDGLFGKILGTRFDPKTLEIGQIASSSVHAIQKLHHFWKADLRLDDKTLVRHALFDTVLGGFYLIFREVVLKKAAGNVSFSRAFGFFRFPEDLMKVVRRIRPIWATNNLLPTSDGLKQVLEFVKEDLDFRYRQESFKEACMRLKALKPEFARLDEDWWKRDLIRPDFFVMALPVQEASRIVCDFVDAEADEPLDQLNRRMALDDVREHEDRYPRFLEKERRHWQFETISEDYRTRRRKELERIVEGDLLKLYDWAKEAELCGPTAPSMRNPDGSPKEPMRHPYRDISGVQFFFRKRVRIGKGHVYFPDSPWALTSISQPDRWRNRIDPERPFLGQNSIDVGDFYTRGKFSVYKTAWNCAPEEFYTETFSQMLSALDQSSQAAFLFRRPGMNVPDFIFLDPNLEFKKTGSGILYNHAPFLINLPAKWKLRPGLILRVDEEAPTQRDIRYSVSNNRWVLAGSYMATHTRMTSMEAACESGRHAVNAILEHLQGADPVNPQYNGAGMYGGQPCEIWNLEEQEPKDFEAFKEVDYELARKGLPHFLDILGTVEWVDRNGVFFKSASEMGENMFRTFQESSTESLTKMALKGNGKSGSSAFDPLSFLSHAGGDGSQYSELFGKLYGNLPKLWSGFPQASEIGKSLEKMLQAALDGLKAATPK